MGCRNPCGDTGQGLEPTSSAKASRLLGSMFWGIEDPRAPPGEKRGSGQGGEPGFLSCPLGGHRCVPPGCRAEKTCFLAQERGFNNQRAVPMTGWGGVSNVIVQKAPREGGACPVSTQQDPAVSGREAVREISRASVIQWPLCKLSPSRAWCVLQYSLALSCLPPET